MTSTIVMNEILFRGSGRVRIPYQGSRSRGFTQANGMAGFS